MCVDFPVSANTLISDAMRCVVRCTKPERSMHTFQNSEDAGNPVRILETRPGGTSRFEVTPTTWKRMNFAREYSGYSLLRRENARRSCVRKRCGGDVIVP